MNDFLKLNDHLLSGGSLTDGKIIISFSRDRMVHVSGFVTTDSETTAMIGDRVDILLSDLMNGRWRIYWPLDNVEAMRALADHKYVKSSRGYTYVMSDVLMVHDMMKGEFVPCKDNPFTSGTGWEVQE